MCLPLPLAIIKKKQMARAYTGVICIKQETGRNGCLSFLGPYCARMTGGVFVSKTLPVGVQVYSVRGDAEKDFAGTMKKIKKMGYDGVELAGLYGLTPEQVRDAIREAGLVPLSAHVPYVELAADMEKVVSDYETIGCQYIAVPYLTPEYRPGTEAFPNVVETIDRIGECCNRHGIVLMYHNHDFEFQTRIDGMYALDYLYKTVPADRLQTEIDTCWVNVAGENPADYVRKYTGRAPVVHLKDFWKKEGKSGKMYELIGIKDDGNGEAEEKTFGFMPVGYGQQDIPSILQASLDAGAKWVVVEQDASDERPPLEAIAMSREYLKKQGW